MPSIELENWDRDSITVVASSTRTSIDTTGEDGTVHISQSQSSQRQQPQRVNSSADRTGTPAGAPNQPSQQGSQQDPEQSEGESESGSTSQGQQQVPIPVPTPVPAPVPAQTEQQTASLVWLQRIVTKTWKLAKEVWDKGIKHRQAEIAVVALIIGVLMVSPTFGQYAGSLWSNAVTYQSWCKSEQEANHTLTSMCNMIVNKPMPPPPGLNEVFKDIGRRDAAPTNMPKPPVPIWPTPTKEELEAARAFANGPVGTGIYFAIHGFIALMLRLEAESGKWARFLFIFNLFWFFRRITLVQAVASVCLLMDWCYWLRKVGVRGPSLGALAVLPILYGVGYMSEKSFTIKIILSVVSVLIVGDHYSQKLLPMLQILERYPASTKQDT
ncbi:hypothetical protein BGW36DRAFT_366141 [Talaromyces proteolyticus]|uniref:Uncharacterized protein n=1 Tax=Talaromyces proteolyticus TaxID=1131652 RepID=A0AAD4L554_9EURO|nr:uncharacterized protein BGW36DRAFT_366141 [Talaromyces proteolyticus]KAH8704765.1 hypothetical protein BGW36DRAFT_366141 [Talaromyces proteolyticus]